MSQEHEQLSRELRRAHRLISDLRARNCVLETALRRAFEVIAPHGGPKAKPVRKQIATSSSGEPVYAPDEPEPDEPPPPDRPRRLRRQTWKSLGEPRLNDDTVGYWPEAERVRMDERFVEAMRHQLQMRKRGAG